MNSTDTISTLSGYNQRTRYDVDVAVLTHGSGRYKGKIDCFKKYGLLNLGRSTVHVTVLGSKGDGEHKHETVKGWPDNVDVTFLEFNSCDPVAKINGYYLWKRNVDMQVRWHIRVDDDSVTDVSNTLNYIDSTFGDMAVHLMTSPHYNEKPARRLLPFFSAKGIHLETVIHEHESSITSEAAMQKMHSNDAMIDILKETGNRVAKPGDHILALIMQCIGVPLVSNPYFSCRFKMDALRLFGGQLFHIHKVDWDHKAFVNCIDALMHGRKTDIGASLLSSIVGRKIEFGRCVGKHLCDLTLNANGTLVESNHSNESTWKLEDNRLQFFGADGLITTAFTTYIDMPSRFWIVGPHMHRHATHYLTALK